MNPRKFLVAGALSVGISQAYAKPPVDTCRVSGNVIVGMAKGPPECLVADVRWVDMSPEDAESPCALEGKTVQRGASCRVTLDDGKKVVLALASAETPRPRQ